MKSKQAFTLVELLVAMAIIAILLGLAVFGISVVQQNARDTQRRSKVNDIEIALNGMIASGQALPSSFAAVDTTAIIIGSSTVQLPGHLQRPTGDLPGASETSVSQTDYCYGRDTTLYAVGVELESGAYYHKTNSGATYTGNGTGFVTLPTDGTGPQCRDGWL